MTKPVKLIILFYFLNIPGLLHAAQFVTEYGLKGCVELKNKTTRVVIDPNVGGRVLVYELNGKNILYFSSESKGLADGKKVGRVDAGRFDFGPVKTIPSHKTYFKGKWQAEITGEYAVRLTSKIDPKHQIQLIRDFTLDENSSQLICKQTLVNVGRKPLRRYLWSRTFVLGGGIYLLPLNPESRFPRKYATYIRYNDVPVIEYIPHQEKNITIENNIMVVTGPPDYKRLLTDGTDGWLACLFDNNVLFLKKYNIDPNRKYGDIICSTASLWHFKDEIYEIEAMGPEEQVLPGDSISFTETWYLKAFPFPANRQPDVLEINTLIKELIKKQ